MLLNYIIAYGQSQSRALTYFLGSKKWVKNLENMIFNNTMTCIANHYLNGCVFRKRFNLDTVFLVSNNSGLGMVRDNLGPKRIAVDFANIDFATIAEGMGGKGLRISHKDQVHGALEEAHSMGGPVVIDARVDVNASHHETVDNEPLR